MTWRTSCATAGRAWPAVHQLDRPDAPQARVELPFPSVWVAPWTREAGIDPLRDTLALTAITHGAQLVDALVAEPTISNVYVRDHRTYRWSRASRTTAT